MAGRVQIPNSIMMIFKAFQQESLGRNTYSYKNDQKKGRIYEFKEIKEKHKAEEDPPKGVFAGAFSATHLQFRAIRRMMIQQLILIGSHSCTNKRTFFERACVRTSSDRLPLKLCTDKHEEHNEKNM